MPIIGMTRGPLCCKWTEVRGSPSTCTGMGAGLVGRDVKVDRQQHLRRADGGAQQKENDSECDTHARGHHTREGHLCGAAQPLATPPPHWLIVPEGQPQEGHKSPVGPTSRRAES